jgi:ferredoxin
MKRKQLLLSLLALLLFIALFAVASEKPAVDPTRCAGCGECVRQCPTGAISLHNGRASIDEDLCIDCRFCVTTCTYRAIRTPK